MCVGIGGFTDKMCNTGMMAYNWNIFYETQLDF